MKGSSPSIYRPLTPNNDSQLSTKLLAYYSVHWEQNQTNHLNNITDSNRRFEINSCLYFQNNNNIDDDTESEQTWEDGCGYVITYPSLIHRTDNLQSYSFDRAKNFFLTSNHIYSNSKKGSFFFYIYVAS